MDLTLLDIKNLPFNTAYRRIQGLLQSSVSIWKDAYRIIFPSKIRYTLLQSIKTPYLICGSIWTKLLSILSIQRKHQDKPWDFSWGVFQVKHYNVKFLDNWIKCQCLITVFIVFICRLDKKIKTKQKYGLIFA